METEILIMLLPPFQIRNSILQSGVMRQVVMIS